MWINNLNPVLLQLGFLQIRWYGLVYVLGFFLAAWWLFQAQKKHKIELDSEGIWDLLFYIMLGILIGSRVFMIFWNPEIYLFHPLNLFKIWEGGMSFHGGFVGSIIACYFYCQKKKLNFWVIADILSAPIILALALGRIANFINGELVGRVWNGSWCVVFPNYDNLCRHPNMIYSFVERFTVFLWLWSLSVRKTFTPGQVTSVRDQPPSPFAAGFIFWNLVLWEGVGRILMDYFREDILYYGWSLGQWFSLIMVIVATVILIKKYRQDLKTIF